MIPLFKCNDVQTHRGCPILQFDGAIADMHKRVLAECTLES